MIISFFAEPKDDREVVLCNALIEYSWVSLEEAKEYDLIEGIYEELEILDNLLKNGNSISWKRNN